MHSGRSFAGHFQFAEKLVMRPPIAVDHDSIVSSAKAMHDAEHFRRKWTANRIARSIMRR
jgi:hypothetical protein